VLDEATRATMGRRSDWKGLLDAPLPAPRPDDAPPRGETPNGKAMNQESDHARPSRLLRRPPIPKRRPGAACRRPKKARGAGAARWSWWR
jgi:hypothetical protein